MTKQGTGCRHCGCRMSNVTNTYEHVVRTIGPDGKSREVPMIRRRRVCRHCQLPYTTVERVEEEEDQPETPPEPINNGETPPPPDNPFL